MTKEECIFLEYYTFQECCIWWT